MQTSESDQIITQLKRVFRRRKSWMFVAVVTVVGPVVYYNETTTPIYESSTTMILDEFEGPTRGYSSQYSREVITSNRLTEIESFAFAEDILAALPEESRARFSLPEARSPEFDENHFLALTIQKNLMASPVRNSNLVRIGAQLYDPVLCRDIANTAAEVFQERNYRIKQEGVMGIRRFVEEQLERFQVQLDRSEQELRDYKERNQVAAFDQQAQEILRRMTDAEVLYNQAKANRSSLEERLERIDSELARQKKDLVPQVTDVANPWAQRLKDKLVELQLQYTDLLVEEYDPAHPKMMELEREIEQTKQNLAEKAMEIAGGEAVLDPITQIENFVNESFSLQVEIESLKAQESALERSLRGYELMLSSLPEKELNLARLTRERDVNQKIYNNLLEKLEESKISQAERIPSIRIIDEAQVSTKPIRPQKKVNLVMGLLVGLIAGTGMAFIREGSASTIDSQRELQKLLQWPVLGGIPRIQRIPSVKLKHATNTHRRSERDNRKIKRNLISLLQPDGGPAEGYRMLRTNLQLQGLGTEFKTLLVTSAAPNDGKSTVVSNLAIATATVGQKTLLLDAEVRRPGMHLVFDVDEKPGLSDLLLAGAEVKPANNGRRKELAHTAAGGRERVGSMVLEEEAEASAPDGRSGRPASPTSEGDRRSERIRHARAVTKMVNTAQGTRIRNLHVLAAGTTIPNTSDALSSHEKQLRTLLDELKKKFEVVIIDCPPVTLVHDAALLAKIADGVLFVTNSMNCDKEMVLTCKSLLETAGANVVGTVLNHVDPVGIYKSNKYYHSGK